MRIGVLAVQGGFNLHIKMLHRLKVATVGVRRPDQLDRLDGIIIPGGETTTMALLYEQYNLVNSLKDKILNGTPVWGTCAGAIMLGCGNGRPQPRLALIDIEVTRNAYGRQVDSFIERLSVEGLSEAFPGVFIRAPILSNPGSDVAVLSELNGEPVMVRQDNTLLSTFHPELTLDLRIHRYFINSMCAKIPSKIQITSKSDQLISFE